MGEHRSVSVSRVPLSYSLHSKYIHGPEATSEYLALSADYKNPATTSEKFGLKVRNPSFRAHASNLPM